MTTQPLKIGDPCLVWKETDFYPGVIKRITATGQVVADCGVWDNGVPRLYRFKSGRYGGNFTEIGTTVYTRHYNHLVIGDEIGPMRDRLTREAATRAGANRIRGIREELTQVNHRDLEAMHKATNKLLDAIVKAKLVASLPQG